ncbi:MAG: hypothetical protein K2L67_02040 [Clostridia bacterium]|nr:hypothetical protein [Clostridia bacterium]
MKKFFAVILFAVCTVCAVLVGCAPDNYRGLKFGKYYLENSDDVYIEIKADHRAFLNNLDFSDLNPEEFWGGDEDWVEGYITVDEVIAAMHGEKEYWYFDDGLLCFEVKANGPIVFPISFDYNGTNELKSNYNGDVYILRK